MAINVDYGGHTLITENIRVGATSQGQSGTDISSAEIAVLDSVTAGTVAASKAVVVDSNKDASAFRNVTVTNLDAGASGTAGSVDVFPTTASKGKLTFAAADSAGDTTTTITNASQAGAVTYTIPDAGASGKFVLGGGNTAISLTGTGGTSTGTMTTLSAQVTSASLTTASLAQHVATITYTGISATDTVLITHAGGSNTRDQLHFKAVCTTNTITVTITNGHASAVNGTIIFNILVLKA